MWRGISGRGIELDERSRAIQPNALAAPGARLLPEERMAISEGEDAVAPGEGRQRRIAAGCRVSAHEDTLIEPALLREKAPSATPLACRAGCAGPRERGDDLFSSVQLIVASKPLRLDPA